MNDYATQVLARLQDAFEPERDAERAMAMSAYMRGKFPYLGIPSPRRSALQRNALEALRKPNPAEVTATVTALWELPEREYQYAACDILGRNLRVLNESFLPVARRLIETKSWWDTVDTLASNTVGGLVRAYPELAVEMDQWVADENLWVARTAILHQLKFKDRTDSERLLRYCALRAADTNFFIRKAIGWALRQYSRTDPEAVRAFVAAHEAELSGLSKREALLTLNGGRKGKRAAG
ncbi:MAG: DNA alkylation repair protein [Dehalococcoidia bacterium]